MKRRPSLTVANISVLGFLLLGTQASAVCFGDLDGSGRVTIHELTVLVSRALDPALNPTPQPIRPTPTRVPTRVPRPTRTPISIGTSTPRVSLEGAHTQSARAGTVTGINDIVLAVDHALEGCPPLVCEAGSVRDDVAHLEVGETVIGMGQTFTDTCSGDLLTEWSCGIDRDCTRLNPRPSDCTIFENGRVHSRTYNCTGGCVNGACRGRCPRFSDILRYVDVSFRDTTFVNETDGRQYDCELVMSPEDDAHCLSDPGPGDRAEIIGVGLMTFSACTDDDFGFIRLENECSYRCGIKRGSDLEYLGGFR